MDHVAPKERAGSVVGFDVVVSRATPATVTEGARSAENIDVVIATETEAGPVLSHRRSRDGGQTWSKDTPIDMHGTTISNAMRGLDPAVAAHGDRLFVVWTTPGEGSHGVGPFATATSDDGGKTWQPGANPSDDGTKRGHAFIDAIADDAGVFHVVWLETRGSRGVIAASSNDFGRTWAANRVVDGKTCECCWNELLSIRPGETHLLYRDTAPRDMAIARTTDSGASWERLATVGDYKWPIEACPFTGGGLAATGPTGRETLHATVFSGEKAHRGVTYLTSPDRGVSWSAPLALGEGRGQHSDIAALGEHLVAVFDRTDSEDGFVVVSRDSKDAGQTWSATRRLSRTGVKADFPRVVSVAGRVVGFWTEKGEDAVVRLAEALLSPADAESEAPVGGTRRD
jgi:hypothetical protein